MKQYKRILSLALTLALTFGLCGVAAPRAEAAGPVVETNVSMRYLVIPESTLLIPSSAGRDEMFLCSDISGLKPGGGDWAYVGLDGHVVRLEEGAVGYQFSEGLVAVVNRKNKLGYLDKQGNQVVPFRFDVCLKDGMRYIGEFQNGTCPVYIKTGETKGIDWNIQLRGYADNGYDWKSKNTEGYWVDIDRSGNVMSEPYDAIQSRPEALDGPESMRLRQPGDPDYPRDEDIQLTVNGQPFMCSFDFINGHGFAYDPTNPSYHDYEGWLASPYYNMIFVLDPIDAQSGSSQGTTLGGSAGSFRRPDLPEYNRACPSHFASTGEVTGFWLADMNYGSTVLTITNPTDVTDSGVIALALSNIDGSSNYMSGVFFVAYELGPHESRDYTIGHRDIVNEAGFSPYVVRPTYAEQLAHQAAATVFEFEDDDDLWAFYDSIPYEQNQHYEVEKERDSAHFPRICDSDAGTAWLKEVAGITRSNPGLNSMLYYYGDGIDDYIPGRDTDHSICYRDLGDLKLEQ